MRLSRRTLLTIGAQTAALAAWSPPTWAAAAGGPAGTGMVLDDDTALRTFDYQGVRLLPSRWQRQQQDVLGYYLTVPTDDYLVGFRRRAGLPAPGSELGGWYSNDIFNVFGQVVSGLARLYAATGSEEALTKVGEMVDGFTRCVADDGYFFYSSPPGELYEPGGPNALHYGYDKALCGLLDAWLYCGSDTARAAMDRVTGWARENLLQTKDYAFAENRKWTEWYTLSENLYRAHLATGDPDYRDFAEVWEYRDFWNLFHRGEENIFQQPDGSRQPSYHAYSHVNSLNGLGAGYLATGDPYYLTALRNAYLLLRDTQTFVTGGYGPFERLLPHHNLEVLLNRGHRHFETQCGSWAVFKLCKYLLRITGDARFGDWAEQMLYNGVGASIQMDPDGSVQYFSNYSSRGGEKQNINPWSCCTGTRPQAVADYTDLVFLHDAAALYVNLFLPARVDTAMPGGPLTARLETDYPASGRIRLLIDRAPATELPIRFRAPEWLQGEPLLRVNGGPATPTPPDARRWITAAGTWRGGDVIELQLPIQLRLAPFTAGHEHPTAIAYGPAAVAVQAGLANPVADRSAEALLAALRRDPGGAPRWTAGPDVVAQPYYALPGDEKYHIYLDPTAGLYIDFTGRWRANENHNFTRIAGASATCEFEGTGVRFRWRQFDDAGIARIEIDDVLVAELDQYAPVRGVYTFSDFDGLERGVHQIRVSCTGEKRSASRSTFINVVDFEAHH